MSERSITLAYDISERDPSFASSTKNYTVSYSIHEPTAAKGDTDLPALVLLHHFNASRHYWAPNIGDPTLAPYLKIAIDAPGFAKSRTSPAGSPWSFDLAAEAILKVLDELSEELGRPDLKAVTYGDSMGGCHTGLRVAMRDEERVTKEGKKARILGAVVVGTCAEEESDDFVRDYTKDAEDFARSCETASPEEVAKLIDEFAVGMGQAGYTESNEAMFVEAREKGTKMIADALKLTLANDDGVLDGKQAGETMKVNYRCLNFRRGLIGALASRPSPLGDRQVLVVHGTQDNAYPFERKYHERTLSAVGNANGELLVVEGGPHFATASHWDLIDKSVVDWIARKCL